MYQRSTNSSPLPLRSRTLEYAALGDTTLPKEWCEIHGEGSTATMDNFCKTVCTGKLGKKKLKGKQQKGFKEELEATVAAVKAGGEMPIKFKEILNVTRATFAVLRAVRFFARNCSKQRAILQKSDLKE